jgi:hypothetical protein
MDKPCTLLTLAFLAMLAAGCYRSPSSPMASLPAIETVDAPEAPPRSGVAVPEEYDIHCLAVVTAESASVYREPRVYAAVVGRVDEGRYVVAQTGRGDLVGVRMEDGALGWMRADALMLLDISSEPEAAVEFPDFEPRGGKPVFRAGNAVVSRAYAYLGIPYVWGGTSRSGLDCSGFVQRVFAEEGIHLPRVAADQYEVGFPVSQSALQAGDRLYFQSGTEVDHTGIYIGDHRFIHSSSSGGGVRVDDLAEPRWQRLYVGARR